MSEDFSRIEANWPAPKNIVAFTTTRQGGKSKKNYTAFNLAVHSGDNLADVAANRQLLQQDLPTASEPFWLNQVHGSQCVKYNTNIELPEADASYSNQPNQVLAVMTADCLPILITDRKGSWVAACHAGWRGLAEGVIEKTLACYSGNSHQLIAWIGPAISQRHFEVGEEVREIFINRAADNDIYFSPNANNRFQFDFIGLARQKLLDAGAEVFGGEYCSYADDKQFYSYRRDRETGRMASLIWIKNN